MLKQVGGCKRWTSVEELGRSGEVLAEKPTPPKSGHSKRVEETPQETPASTEAEAPSGLMDAPQEAPPVVNGTVMGRITISELEMRPKMEELRRLEEIFVGGTTKIHPDVIGAIAGVAAQSVAGVASLGTPSLRKNIRERVGGNQRRGRGVEVEVGTREVMLDISFKVIYGYSIPEAVIQVRQNVANQLLDLCGLVSKEINIKVVGIEFPQRMPGRVQ